MAASGRVEQAVRDLVRADALEKEVGGIVKDRKFPVRVGAKMCETDVIACLRMLDD